MTHDRRVRLALAVVAGLIPSVAIATPADAAPTNPVLACDSVGCAYAQLSCSRGAYGIVTCNGLGRALNYPQEASIRLTYEILTPDGHEMAHGVKTCFGATPCTVQDHGSAIARGTYKMCVQTRHQIGAAASAPSATPEPTPEACAAVSVK